MSLDFLFTTSTNIDKDIDFLINPKAFSTSNVIKCYWLQVNLINNCNCGLGVKI